MAQPPTSVVIVGGGLAGAKTAEALRDQGYSGPVTLIGAESQLPYERPPLSKGYLAGNDAFDDAIVHPAEWYDQHDITLRLDTEVAAVHPDKASIELAGGESVDYGVLVLATGSAPRRLPIPGAETALTLRSREDSDAIRNTFGEGKRLVIVGAGWIGLEVAAAARGKGTEVTVLEYAELPLLAVLGREMAAVFADLHREHGVDLRFGVSVAEIASDGVKLADGTHFPADAVLLGVGAAPRTQLAEAAGLATDNGVLVDASLRTSDPAIWAVGDIASQDHPVLGRRVRVEHWATALNQPAAAVAAILGHDTAGYRDLPYFFSDQYDLGMEYIGLAGSDARVVTRGDVDKREFVAFWLDGEDHIVAAMNVNVWDVVDEIKPLIAERRPVDVGKLTDSDVPYAEVAK